MARQPDDITVRRVETDVPRRTEIYAVPNEERFPISAAHMLTQDRVRWGPIVAGLVTALTALVLLGLLGAAIGLTSVNAGANAAQGTVPNDVGRNTAIWGAISALIAFFIGGLVTGRTAAVFDRNWGALNGALVFLLAVPFALWLAGQGFGAMMGFMGSVAQGAGANLGQIQGAVQGIQGSTTPTNVQVTAEGARNAAWGALLGALIGLLASILGGMAGTRTRIDVHPPVEHVHD